MRLIPLVILVAGCAGASAERPLTVALGQSHDATEAALKNHQFCLKLGSSDVKQTQQKQTYPRCDRPASELGDAWVIARYQGDKLIELRRFERYADDAHAVKRWNDLVGERMKIAPLSDEAEQQIKQKGEIEAGTRSMKAFKNADGSVVGVYLLNPSPPDNANVLEKITYVNN